MQSVTPCLWFDNQAEDAAKFYTAVFEDSEILDTTRYGTAGPGPEGSVMTVTFRIGEQRFVGLNGGPADWSFSEAVSFQVYCESQEEVDHLWERLTDGGQPGQCGWLKDRYGVSWQIIPAQLGELLGDPDPARAQRAMAAMLLMDKLDIDALRRATEGAEY